MNQRESRVTYNILMIANKLEKKEHFKNIFIYNLDQS